MRPSNDPPSRLLEVASLSFGFACRNASVIGASVLALALANCSTSSGRHPSERKYGVASSPRVIAEGQPVPKGGGRDVTGKPYVVAGRTYMPHPGKGYDREGWASWYGSAFHGRLTANGEIFDRDSIAAAHPNLPLPSYVRVTNLQNSRSMVVRVNDRGPYERDRVIDLSERAADALGFHRKGTVRVRVQYVGRASLAGSDDAKLLASLRTDGTPATLGAPRTVVADAGGSKDRVLSTDPKAQAAALHSRDMAVPGRGLLRGAPPETGSKQIYAAHAVDPDAESSARVLPPRRPSLD